MCAPCSHLKPFSILPMPRYQLKPPMPFTPVCTGPIRYVALRLRLVLSGLHGSNAHTLRYLSFAKARAMCLRSAVRSRASPRETAVRHSSPRYLSVISTDPQMLILAVVMFNSWSPGAAAEQIVVEGAGCLPLPSKLTYEVGSAVLLSFCLCLHTGYVLLLLTRAAHISL